MKYLGNKCNKRLLHYKTLCTALKGDDTHLIHVIQKLNITQKIFTKIINKLFLTGIYNTMKLNKENPETTLMLMMIIKLLYQYLNSLLSLCTEYRNI